jgi:hypothetical protein
MPTQHISTSFDVLRGDCEKEACLGKAADTFCSRLVLFCTPLDDVFFFLGDKSLRSIG